MPINGFDLRASSGLGGARPRETGMGLALDAPGLTPPPRISQPNISQPAGERPRKGFNDIGSFLKDIGASLQGKPLPSDEEEERQMKRDQIKMLQVKNQMDIVSSIAELASQMPGNQSEAFVDGMTQKFPDMIDTELLKAFIGDGGVAQAGGIVQDKYAQAVSVLGRKQALALLNDKDTRERWADETADENLPGALAKIGQAASLARQAGQAGMLPPGIAGQMAGTMTIEQLDQMSANFPEQFRLTPQQRHALKTRGGSVGGVTILSEPIAVKVAEADALRPGKMAEYEQKQMLQQKYDTSPGGRSEQGTYGNSLEGRATDRLLQYDNMTARGETLSPEQEADRAAALRIVNKPVRGIDPQSGLAITTNPEPWPGTQPANEPAAPQPQGGAVQPQDASGQPGAAQQDAYSMEDQNAGLFAWAEKSTGMPSAVREGIGRGPGQIAEGWTNRPVLESRSRQELAGREAVSAFMQNPRFPEGERKALMKMFGTEPSMFESKVTLRARQIAIDGELEKTIQQSRSILEDPTQSITNKRNEKATMAAAVRYRKTLGVPPLVDNQEAVDLMPKGFRFRIPGDRAGVIREKE